MGYYDYFTEVSVEYAFMNFVLLLRLYARAKCVGFRGFQGDDYTTIVLLPVVASSYITKYFLREGLRAPKIEEMTPERVKELSTNNRINYSTWIIYFVGTWLLKACMLFLYKRITWVFENKNSL
jgi:hypothetical protein